MTRPAVGSVDGVRLKHLLPGRAYRVWPALAAYLLAVGAAVRGDGCGRSEEIPPHARVRIRTI